MRKFFSAHPRLVTALQLLLDVLPLIVLALHLLSGFPIRMLTSGWSPQNEITPSTFYYVTLVLLMIIPIPAFVTGMLWEPQQVPMWQKCLRIPLRVVGGVTVGISLLLDIVLFFPMLLMLLSCLV